MDSNSFIAPEGSQVSPVNMEGNLVIAIIYNYRMESIFDSSICSQVQPIGLQAVAGFVFPYGGLVWLNVTGKSDIGVRAYKLNYYNRILF